MTTTTASAGPRLNRGVVIGGTAILVVLPWIPLGLAKLLSRPEIVTYYWPATFGICLGLLIVCGMIGLVLMAAWREPWANQMGRSFAWYGSSFAVWLMVMITWGYEIPL